MNKFLKGIVIVASGLILIALTTMGVVTLLAVSNVANNLKSIESRVTTLESKIATDVTTTITVTPTTAVTTTTTKELTVKLYYKNYTNDPDVSDCTASDYVLRQVPDDGNSIKATLDLLLENKLTTAETASGLVSSFLDSDYATKKAKFEVASITVSNKVATVTLTDPLGFTNGGSCRVSILQTSIVNTLKQFSSITSVQFLPEGQVFQP